MRYGWVVGAALAAMAGTTAAAQDKAAFCEEARGHVGAVAQGIVDVIDKEGAFASGVRVIAATHDDDNLDAVSALADAKLEGLGATMGPMTASVTALSDLLKVFCYG